jgi:hypothetical protein
MIILKSQLKKWKDGQYRANEKYAKFEQTFLPTMSGWAYD